MESSDIPKPRLYKHKWLIWTDTVFEFLNISDCNDTINGICLSGKTVEQCIDECHSGSSAGYHIQFQDGSSICVPIITDMHPTLNPVHRLRNQSIYSPALDHVKVTTFVDTDVFPFPPEEANVVFYGDILVLKDIENGYTIGTEYAEIKGQGRIYMGKEKDDNIQILPAQKYAPQLLKYQPVLYGDTIHFSVPGTSLIAGDSMTIENALIWELSTGVFHGDDMAFRILPISGKKRIGNVITYDDTFIVQYTDSSIVAVNPQYNYLQLMYNISPDYHHEFQFISKMTGYYCDGTKCKSVPIKDIKTIGEAGRYKGVTVGRNKKCWGTCNYRIPGTNSIYTYSTYKHRYQLRHNIVYVILGMSFLVILSIIMVRIFIRKK